MTNKIVVEFFNDNDQMTSIQLLIVARVFFYHSDLKKKSLTRKIFTCDVSYVISGYPKIFHI